MDHRARLDGYCVHSEFKAVRTDSLPLHGPLLPRDDRTGARVCLSVIPVDFYAWLSLAVLILGGSMIIWWATERAWGKFLRRDDSF